MDFIKIDNALSAAKDWHLPASIFIFITGSALQVWHHLDMAYVAFATAILSAITGHAFSPAGSKDVPPGPPHA